MGTVSSPSELQDVGVSSGGPPPISSSATKRKKWVKSTPTETQQKSLRNSPLKRPIPIETSTNKQPAAKRTKHSTTESQEKTSTNSPLKRPMETLTKKQPPGKRFKPPMAEKSPLVRRSPLARNPQLRLAMSPVVIAHGQRSSPSPPPVAVDRSPSTSAPLYLDEETSLPGNCCLCPHFVSVIVYMLFRV
jgi:hypothetical protein